MKHVPRDERQLALVFDGEALESALRQRLPKTGVRTDLPSRAELEEYFSLDPETGRLTNRKSRGRARQGEEPGCIDHSQRRTPYRRLGFKGRLLYTHTVVYILSKGEIPLGKEVDHEDGDTLHNVPSNLRLVTRQQNTQNRAISARNTTGVMGVYSRDDGKRYAARIGGKHIGTFNTIAEAKKARIDAVLSAGYHPNHGRAA